MIKVYTTSSCVYCKLAKKFLDNRGVEYQELDVSQDAEAREELGKLSSGVPVIDVNGKVFIGFNPSDTSELEKAIKEIKE